RDGTRIAIGTLAVGRLDDIALDEERRLIRERIHARRIGIRHEHHVGGLYALPARDRRTDEVVAVRELAVAEVASRHRYVLLLAPRIGEAQVRALDLVVIDRFQYVGASGHELS